MIKGYWRFGTGVTVEFTGQYDIWFDSELQGSFINKFEKHDMPLGVHEVILAPVGVNPEGKEVSFIDMSGKVTQVKTWRPIGSDL